MAYRAFPLTATVVVLSIAEGALMTAIPSLMKSARPEAEGLTQGMLSSVNAFARSTSPVLTGALTDRFSLASAYTVLGLLCGAGAALLAGWSPPVGRTMKKKPL